MTYGDLARGRQAAARAEKGSEVGGTPLGPRHRDVLSSSPQKQHYDCYDFICHCMCMCYGKHICSQTPVCLHKIMYVVPPSSMGQAMQLRQCSAQPSRVQVLIPLPPLSALRRWIS